MVRACTYLHTVHVHATHTHTHTHTHTQILFWPIRRALFLRLGQNLVTNSRRSTVHEYASIKRNMRTTGISIWYLLVAKNDRVSFTNSGPKEKV